uniref:RNase H type-1 domain-containing protein n=1 Tax=Fagus sylvatica TaxID=28930 RepID=A0A2N9GD20_FAGSY
MQGFRAVINDCGFLDLGFRGLPFTWCNNCRGNATTWLRLDRCMATNDWLLWFHSAVVDHMECTTSDHKPICLNTQAETAPRPRQKIFRFEDMWRMDPGCEPTVTKAWIPKIRGSPIAQVKEKIQRCGVELQKWCRAHFGNITKLLKEKTDQLRQAEMDSTLGFGHDLVISIHREVNELLLKEEKMWKQRSRESWLKEGDRNTKYFHSRASHRRRRNSILSVTTDEGEIVTDSEMNQSLICQFTETEVITAMKQMAPLKAPEPDGMPPVFYQSYWHVVGKDISAAVLYCLHSGRVGSMALKLDMSKAYDRVEWGFLRQVMVRMGFHERWISLIMECISTVTYSLLINGNPTGLNGLIKKASLQGEIHGEILATYEKASGQQLNRAKTTLFFSRNTPQTIQEALKDTLGVPSIQQYEKYLGLPSLIGKEKITCFSQIKERVWSKVKGWKEKLLSQAGREILIKAVVQAIPTYTMNCFKLPVTLCKEIECIIRKFWWGQNGDKRKIYWLRWEKLCSSKGVGGLGFRDLQKFNIALLAKQFWRLMHSTNSLLYKVFSAKFFPSGNILEASENNRGSFAWHSILKAKALILSGFNWRVGDGSRIPIKGSNWLPDEGHRRVLSPLIDLPKDARVAELIHGSPPTWNIHKFGSRDGKYTVRSGHKLLLRDVQGSQPESSRQWDPDPLWKRIWGARVPAKVKSFLWRACHDALPTNSGIFKRKVIPTPHCSLCRNQCEDSTHALWACPVVSQAWTVAPEFFDLRKTEPMPFSVLVSQVIQINSDVLLEKFATRAQAFLQEYLTVTTEEKTERPKPPPAQWKLPVTNYYKLNFDGAIFKDSNSGGIGVVIRDNTGLVIATLSQKVYSTHTAEMIEALAARRAIIFAKEVGIDDVEVEGDAETVMRDLSSSAPLHTPYGLVLEDTKVLIQEFQCVTLSHTRRSGNSVAHALTRRASDCNSFLVWMEEVPPDITHVLLNDFFALS